MSDPITVANIDLSNITDFQKEMYDVLDENSSTSLIPRFLATFKQRPWSDNMLIKLSRVEEAGKYIYSPNMKFDFLLYCFYYTQLPFLKVKEEHIDKIQICWTHNLAHNITKKCEMYYDDSTPQTFDTVSLDIYRQFYLKKKLRKTYDINIGNDPRLISWTSELLGLTIKPHQPWYFSEKEYFALPILQFNDRNDTKKSDIPIRFIYEFNLDISKLLRMRRLVPDNMASKTKGAYRDEGRMWKDIPCRFEYLNGVPNTHKLPVPEIYGRHVLITPEERIWYKELCNSKPYKIYITDIISKDSDNNYKYQSQARLDIDYKASVRALHFVAENMEAKRNRLYSNYTTNSNDISQGYSPIESYELVYFNAVRIPKTNFEFASEIEANYHFPSVPFEPGYGGLSFAYGKCSLDKGSVISDTSLSFNKSKAQIVLNLGSTDPYSKSFIPEGIQNGSNSNGTREDEDFETRDLLDSDTTEICETKIDSSTNFTIHVRTVIVKKLTFSNSECQIEI